MEQQPNASLPRKEEAIAGQIAALLYYDDHREDKEKISFELLSEEIQKPYVVRALMFLVIIDKLNKRLCPKIDQAEAEEKRNHNLDILTDRIQAFVNGLKKPKNIAQLFPSRELAAKILE